MKTLGEQDKKTFALVRGVLTDTAHYSTVPPHLTSCWDFHIHLLGKIPQVLVLFKVHYLSGFLASNQRLTFLA